MQKATAELKIKPSSTKKEIQNFLVAQLEYNYQDNKHCVWESWQRRGKPSSWCWIMNIRRPGICFNHGSSDSHPLLAWRNSVHSPMLHAGGSMCCTFGTKTVGRRRKTNVVCYSNTDQMSVIEREGYDIIFGLRWFETYLIGTPIIIISNNSWSTSSSTVCMPRLLGVIFASASQERTG